MKPRISNNILAVWALFLVSGLCLAAKPDFEERKQVNKFYAINTGTNVSFTNSFGKIHIDTWDKNELKVDIEIITRSSNQSKAKEMLDKIRIEIEDSNPTNGVSFKTTNEVKSTGGNNSFEINYRVSIPTGNPLYVKNSFGDTYLGNYSGNVKLNASYGNLKTGKLDGDSEVDLSFSSGTSYIEALYKGYVKIGYSKLDIGTVGRGEINSQFSTLEVEKAVDVELTAKYGEVEFGEINSLVADVGFSSLRITKLNKKLLLDVRYGGNTTIKGVSKDIQMIEIENSFGPVTLEIPSGLNARIDAETSFSELDYKDVAGIDFNKVIKGNTSSEYHGKIGNGSQAVYIKLETKYGDIRLRTAN